VCDVYVNATGCLNIIQISTFVIEGNGPKYSGGLLEVGANSYHRTDNYEMKLLRQQHGNYNTELASVIL
jgi:hypothetical protein